MQFFHTTLAQPAWGWIGLVGAFLFMLVQLVLLVDFAHSWNESWLARLEDGQNCYKWGESFLRGRDVAQTSTDTLLPCTSPAVSLHRPVHWRHHHHGAVLCLLRRPRLPVEPVLPGL